MPKIGKDGRADAAVGTATGLALLPYERGVCDNRIVRVHDVKAYRWSRSRTPLVLNVCVR